MAIGEFLQNVRDRVMVDDEPEISPELKAEIDSAGEGVDHDVLEPDPQPARKSRTRAAKPAPARAPKVTVATRKQVADALTVMIKLPAGGLSLKDPVCGGAVLGQADELVESLVPIICRNPRMLDWFTSGAGYLDWFAVATAVFPIVKTVWSHHVTHPHQAEDPFHGNPPDFSHYTAPDLAD